jgi:transposase
LFTRNGKSLTAKGVKPVCAFQQVFQNLWLFGSFSPIDGDSFLLEMPHCNTTNFQHYLNEFSKQRPDEYKIMVLDNGAFHKSKLLIIPENIGLIFLPPYSPELNPAEKIWAILKRKFTNNFYKSLEDVSLFITESVNDLTVSSVKKTCAFEYVFLHDNWTT